MLSRKRAGSLSAKFSTSRLPSRSASRDEPIECRAGVAGGEEPVAQLADRIAAERDRELDARGDRDELLAVEDVRELDRRDERARQLVEPGRRCDDVTDVAPEHGEHVGIGGRQHAPSGVDLVEHARELGRHRVRHAAIDLDVDRVVIERGDHLERIVGLRDLDDVIVVVILAAGRGDRAVDRECRVLDERRRGAFFALIHTQRGEGRPQHVHDLVYRRTLVHALTRTVSLIKARAAKRAISRVLCSSDHSSRPDVAVGLERPTRSHRAGNATPVWSCFGWGLPCPRRHRRGGALLPHRFTLTRS